MLRGWLDGADVPAGLTIDTELRWSVLRVAGRQRARPAPAEIEAELAGDRTASGEREAALRPRADARPRRTRPRCGGS